MSNKGPKKGRDEGEQQKKPPRQLPQIGLSFNDAEKTTRVKVDPWTGKIIRDFPDTAPDGAVGPGENDATSRIEIDHNSGDYASYNITKETEIPQSVLDEQRTVPGRILDDDKHDKTEKVNIESTSSRPNLAAQPHTPLPETTVNEDDSGRVKTLTGTPIAELMGNHGTPTPSPLPVPPSGPQSMASPNPHAQTPYHQGGSGQYDQGISSPSSSPVPGYPSPGSDPYSSPGSDPYSAPTSDAFGAPTSDPYGSPTSDPYTSPLSDPYGSVQKPKKRSSMIIAIVLIILALSIGAGVGSAITIYFLSNNQPRGHQTPGQNPGTLVVVTPTKQPEKGASNAGSGAQLPQKADVGTPPLTSENQQTATPPSNTTQATETPQTSETPPTTAQTADVPSESPEEAPQSPPAQEEPDPEVFELPDQMVLPMSFPLRSASPENVDEAQFRNIAQAMIKNRNVRCELTGFVAPEESGLQGLDYRRAVSAMGLIGQFGPSRSRFQAQSGGVDENSEPERARKVILRVTHR